MVLCFFFFPWMCSGGRRVYVFVFFRVLSLSLSSPNLTKRWQDIPPPHTLQSRWRKERGAMPCRRLPMPPYPAPWQDRTRWPPLLLLINTGRQKKKGEEEKRGGKKKEKKEKKERQGEKVREKEERNINTKTGDWERTKGRFFKIKRTLWGERRFWERERLFENQRELKT